MAVAGFNQSELKIEVNQINLTISADKQADDSSRTYLHQGIAARSFERRFQLADHVQVRSAVFENGLLHIELVREIPEAMKPRTIPIDIGSVFNIENEAGIKTDVKENSAA